MKRIVECKSGVLSVNISQVAWKDAPDWHLGPSMRLLFPAYDSAKCFLLIVHADCGLAVQLHALCKN